MKLNTIYNENCLAGLKRLSDNSIDCCITSPPYWGLRDYGHEEQIGSEHDFKEFINNLSNIFNEVKRVLKPTGTCFVNLGDTYGGSGGVFNKDIKKSKQVYSVSGGESLQSKLPKSFTKCLLMIPERFSIEMIDRGWVLRNQIIWHKPNQMPSSAKDRFTVDFEKIFFFVKDSSNYYFNQQLEPSLTYEKRKGGIVRDREQGYDSKQDKIRISLGKKSFSKRQSEGCGTPQSGNAKKDFYELPITKNMRTVWSINTEPSTEAHFATYPQKIVEVMIRAGCPENGVVLDPFMGAGTTAIVARKMSRDYIGFEINNDYIKISKQRLNKALGFFQ